MRIQSTFIVAALALFAAACSGTPDPKQEYDRLVKAAEARDYGYLYDALDVDMKRNVDSLIALSRASKASMPPQEQKFWDSLGKASNRDAFVAMMGRDPEMSAALRGKYTVLKVDTMVVLTVQREGKPADLWYFQNEGGKLKVSDPPQAPRPQMPAGHPQMPEGMPQQGMPEQGMPQQGMPQAPSESKPDTVRAR